MEEAKLSQLLMEKIVEQVQILQLSPDKVAKILDEDMENIEQILKGFDAGLSPDILYNYLLKLNPDRDYQNACA